MNHNLTRRDIFKTATALPFVPSQHSVTSRPDLDALNNEFCEEAVRMKHRISEGGCISRLIEKGVLPQGENFNFNSITTHVPDDGPPVVQKPSRTEITEWSVFQSEWRSKDISLLDCGAAEKVREELVTYSIKGMEDADTIKFMGLCKRHVHCGSHAIEIGGGFMLSDLVLANLRDGARPAMTSSEGIPLFYLFARTDRINRITADRKACVTEGSGREYLPVGEFAGLILIEKDFDEVILWDSHVVARMAPALGACDVKWLNVPDPKTNPRGETGFYRTDMCAGWRPGLTMLGAVIHPT